MEEFSSIYKFRRKKTIEKTSSIVDLNELNKQKYLSFSNNLPIQDKTTRHRPKNPGSDYEAKQKYKSINKKIKKNAKSSTNGFLKSLVDEMNKLGQSNFGVSGKTLIGILVVFLGCFVAVVYGCLVVQGGGIIDVLEDLD